jgi:stage V sporulation protein K
MDKVSIRKKRKRDYSYDINNISDLITFTHTYRGRHVNIDLLANIIDPLLQLNDMIGLESVKRTILDMIMYYTQNYHLKNNDYLNIIICGSPGSGKTTIAHILTKILAGLHILNSDKITIVKRPDMIGQYLGQTSHIMKELLKKCQNGVMFIDEAYSLASQDERCDFFAKEALDYLNGFLSEHKSDIICIIAGYEKELEETFFAMNSGLKRRFPWKFVIEPYTAKELFAIFNIMLSTAGYTVQDNAINEDFFSVNKEYFTYGGGDIETFITKCKFVHCRLTFGGTKSLTFTKKVIQNALLEHKKHCGHKKHELPIGMYV